MDIDKDGEVAPELTQGAVEPDRGRKPIDSESTKTPTAKPFTQPKSVAKSYLLDACSYVFFPRSGVRNFQGSASKVATLSAKSKSGTVHFFGETLSCRGLVQGDGIWGKP